MPCSNSRRIIQHGPASRVVAWLMLLALAACGGSDDTGSAGAGGSGGSGGSVGQNAPPTITGSPAGNALVGSLYSFQPVATDPENGTLSYAIQNKPAWATFNTSSGALTGTPAVANLGTTSNIVISVSDGVNNVSLAAFSISVNQAALASALVSWTAPTTNTDGSALADLAGFHVYYGTSAGGLNSMVDAPGAATRSRTVSSLVPGTYFFGVSAYTQSGAESAQSSPVSATVQ